MEEIVFFNFDEAISFLSSSGFNASINSLIEQETKELMSNPSLVELSGEFQFKKFGNHNVPASSVFVYYPWRNSILITHGREVFNAIKYTRNNYKINSNEQNILLTKTIGVVGLSVGCSIVKTLVMEGLCGKLKIADFDTLDLSNTNRIDWGVFDIGKTKVDLVYKWIKESNPFIEVEVFDEGINNTNADNFFGTPTSGLDVVIDECDSLKTKILLRQYAKLRGIPLIMHTSDRGMLDIENYSLEQEHESFLMKFVDYSDEDLRLNMGKIIADFCEIGKASERSIFSFTEIGKSITSWPQLAEDVISGAGNTSNVVRRILLGEKLLSQRAYINCDNLQHL
jgi:molybdopterin/thiamine biosynthesis adenylyltransferase